MVCFKSVCEEQKKLDCFHSIGSRNHSSVFGVFDKFFNPVWISYYVIGYALGIIEKQKLINTKALTSLIGVAALIGNAIQIYCSYVSYKDFSGYQYFCDFSHAMLGVFMFLALMILCDKLKLGKGMEGLLHFTDKYSYEMYLVHHLIILGHSA